jgi:hypothetical protein
MYIFTLHLLGVELYRTRATSLDLIILHVTLYHLQVW